MNKEEVLQRLSSIDVSTVFEAGGREPVNVVDECQNYLETAIKMYLAENRGLTLDKVKDCHSISKLFEYLPLDVKASISEELVRTMESRKDCIRPIELECTISLTEYVIKNLSTYEKGR